MSINNYQHIILLTALDVWSMGSNKGAQSLYRTLQGLAGIAHVHYLTSTKQTDISDDLHPNITIRRFGFPWLDKTFHPSNRFHFLRFMTFPIWWLLFQITSLWLVSSLLLKYGSQVKVLYAYEVMGVPIMKLISLLSRKPIVTRFQGTILYPLLSKSLSRFTQFHHFLALKTNADLLIMANDGTKGDVVLQRLNNKSKKTFFWLNGVDPPSKPTESEIKNVMDALKLSDGHRVLLTVSRLAGWKRVDRALQALADINDSAIHLIVIGEGDEKVHLTNLSKTYNIESQLHFIGAVQHSKLGAYYHIADIFLSLYSLSNVGNPLLEAMSLGKAIITLNNGDTGKYVTNLKTGILLQENDQTAISKSIKQILSNNRLRTDIGNNARQFAQGHFWTWEDRIGKEVEQISLLFKK